MKSEILLFLTSKSMSNIMFLHRKSINEFSSHNKTIKIKGEYIAAEKQNKQLKPRNKRDPKRNNERNLHVTKITQVIY